MVFLELEKDLLRCGVLVRDLLARATRGGKLELLE
jgi:hypothetical protein